MVHLLSIKRVASQCMVRFIPSMYLSFYLSISLSLDICMCVYIHVPLEMLVGVIVDLMGSDHDIVITYVCSPI